MHVQYVGKRLPDSGLFCTFTLSGFLSVEQSFELFKVVSLFLHVLPNMVTVVFRHVCLLVC